MKKIYLIIIIVVAAVAVLVYFFVLKPQQERSEELLKKIGKPPEIKAKVVNPIENLPSANPFEEGKMNPIENAYKNPFD